MEQEQNRNAGGTGRTRDGESRDVRPALPETGNGTPRCNAYDEGYDRDTVGGSGSGLRGLNNPSGANGKNGADGADSEFDIEPKTPPGGAGDSPVRPLPSPDGNAGSGTLIFQVSTGSGALPLAGAEVTVMDCLGDESGGLSGDTVGVLFSGNDGRTQPLTLSAPSRAWSLEERPAGSPLPYALYNAEAELNGYYTQTFLRIPVFDGITSVQQIDLIPLPLSDRPGRRSGRGQTVTEGAGETL